MNPVARSEGVDPAVLQGQLFDLWSRKELEVLRLQAVSGFSQLLDPLVGLLTMLENCPGIQKGKSSTLGQFILTEFVRWRRSHPQVTLKELTDEEKQRLQLSALSLIIASQPGYMDPLLDIYELGTLETSHLLEHVTYLQSIGGYREAALLSMKVELQKELDMEQICVPLILLDKLPLAESYVRDHPELQKRLVRLLDSWCIPDFNLEELRRQYPLLSLSKHQTDQIQPKLLSRHVFRLMEKFSVDPSVFAYECVCASSRSSLIFLLSLKDESFKCCLSDVPVLMVYQVLRCVVGVDMEWRAGFGTVSTQRVALIQLAVEGQVFLLDLCAHSLSHHSLTVQFIRTLLTDKNVLKLGYGTSGDFRSLVATWPELKEEPLAVKGMLDLLHVHQQVIHTTFSTMEVSEGSPEKGLSLLVQQVLGKPLDKTEQLSNWERRPLRTGQLRYAAADAYCLLDVYLTLSKDPKAFGLPEDLCSISSSQPSSHGPAGDNQECVKGNGERQATTVAPHELRVVCDNMLQGLGRFLRCLGVDVLILENTDDHKVAAELARTEGRIILTSGQPYQSLRSQVAEGRCLTLDCSEKARDQAVHVLKHFHVHLTPSDIFSRCQACNNNEYLKVSREDMTEMLNKRGLLQDNSDLHNTQVPEGWRSPDAQTFNPHCRWASRSVLDPETFRFRGGAEIQLETVPPGLLPRIPEYFICTGCGKVFWEGTHYDRVLSQFQEVLHLSDGEVSSQP
uniref:3'-5' exonuclease domain-containing protein n=1 Tax=Pygocentrus nattereri TaxID=42514 RepID=A0AAR2L7A4_PYGNA